MTNGTLKYLLNGWTDLRLLTSCASPILMAGIAGLSYFIIYKDYSSQLSKAGDAEQGGERAPLTGQAKP